jgi:hypothetical protein
MASGCAELHECMWFLCVARVAPNYLACRLTLLSSLFCTRWAQTFTRTCEWTLWTDKSALAVELDTMADGGCARVEDQSVEEGNLPRAALNAASVLAEVRAAHAEAQRALDETAQEDPTERDHALRQCIVRLELALENADPQYFGPRQSARGEVSPITAVATPPSVHPAPASAPQPLERACAVIGWEEAESDGSASAPGAECSVCAVCSDPFDPAQCISCTHGHRICSTCIIRFVEIEFREVDLTALAEGWRAGVVYCPFCRAAGKIRKLEVLACAPTQEITDMLVAVHARVKRHRTELLEMRLSKAVEEALEVTTIVGMDPEQTLLFFRAYVRRRDSTLWLLIQRQVCCPGCGLAHGVPTGSMHCVCFGCSAYFCGGCGTDLHQHPMHIQAVQAAGRSCERDYITMRVVEYLEQIEDPRVMLHTIVGCERELAVNGVELETRTTCEI